MLALLSVLPLLAVAFATPIKRASNQKIQAQRDGKCLAPVPGAQYSDGLPVVSVDCAIAPGWDISPGAGCIILTGTNFALDIGLNPGNNGPLKIWTSYCYLNPLPPQQNWYLTDDKRIAQTGGNQCLDEGTNGVQTYQCTTGNTNQIWNVGGGPIPPVNNSNPFPNIPAGPVYPDPPTGGRRFNLFGRKDLCMTVLEPITGNGDKVALTYCFANPGPSDPSPFLKNQLWNIPVGVGSNNRFTLAARPDLCLDANTNPHDGSALSLWPCRDFPQQIFNNAVYPPYLWQTANNQCIDARRESVPGNQQPFPSQADLQTWTCSVPDPYQQFTLAN